MIDSRLKKGLGRGLSSLLGDTSKKIETNKVSITDLVRNKFQPRKNFIKESFVKFSLLHNMTKLREYLNLYCDIYKRIAGLVPDRMDYFQKQK